MKSVNRSISFKTHSRNQLLKIADEAVQYFSGDVHELNSAIGMLFTGYHFGWKFLLLAHSKAAIKKYELILDIKIRESFDEFGGYASRSVGLNNSLETGSYWKALKGAYSIKDRSQIVSDEELKLYAAFDWRDSLNAH